MEFFVNENLKGITACWQIPRIKPVLKCHLVRSNVVVVLYNLKTSIKETKMQSVAQADNLRLSLAVVVATTHVCSYELRYPKTQV